MEKIKLNDGTTIEIESGSSEFKIATISNSVDEVIANFTDENLERFEILNESGEICAVYTQKHMKKLGAELTEEGYLITISLGDVDIYDRVATLEKTLNALLSEKAASEANEEMTE